MSEKSKNKNKIDDKVIERICDEFNLKPEFVIPIANISSDSDDLYNTIRDIVDGEVEKSDIKFKIDDTKNESIKKRSHIKLWRNF